MKPSTGEILSEEGYTEERASMVIVDEYFPGGADEHQLGLTFDVCTDAALNLDVDFGLTPQGQWLEEHAWEYGFIFRGAEGAPKIYKPWQLRYVGETHAAIMEKLHLSLDEYLAYLEDNYGLQINKDDYYVTYEAFAENLPPTVKVTLR